jgi:hypothetical protein
MNLGSLDAARRGQWLATRAMKLTLGAGGSRPAVRRYSILSRSRGDVGNTDATGPIKLASGT